MSPKRLPPGLPMRSMTPLVIVIVAVANVIVALVAGAPGLAAGALVISAVAVLVIALNGMGS